MPFAIWLVESRLVVRWTLIPVLSWNGLRTSRNAFSSSPPHAVQTVTSVDDAPPPEVPPPPVEQATTRSNVPRPSAFACELSLAKTSAIRAPPKMCRGGTPKGPSARLSARQDERSPWFNFWIVVEGRKPCQLRGSRRHYTAPDEPGPHVPGRL